MPGPGSSHRYAVQQRGNLRAADVSAQGAGGASPNAVSGNVPTALHLDGQTVTVTRRTWGVYPELSQRKNTRAWWTGPVQTDYGASPEFGFAVGQRPD